MRRVPELLGDFAFPLSCSSISFFFKSKAQDIQPEILWLLFMYGKYLTVQVRKPNIQKLKGNPKLLGSSQSD